ncbi:MAG TPA: hypothetical protein VIY51_02470 [Xanthobacteraceae bacterium]
MRFHSPFLLGAMGAAVAGLSFAAALAVPTTIARPTPALIAPPGIGDSVNRATKGDRLRTIVRPPGVEPFDVELPHDDSPQLLEGCESVVGRMVHSSAAKLAQSCVT